MESRCRFVNPLDRAAEVFTGLKMDQTAQRNAVLVYVALKDRQLALYGDKGIHEKVGDAFWNAQVRMILSHFYKENYAEGIAKVVGEIGEALHSTSLTIRIRILMSCLTTSSMEGEGNPIIKLTDAMKKILSILLLFALSGGASAFCPAGPRPARSAAAGQRYSPCDDSRPGVGLGT